jgi:cytochrome c oxidase subunit III
VSPKGFGLEAGEYHPPIPNGRVGFWLFLGTEAMLFAGLLAAFIVARSTLDKAWPAPTTLIPSDGVTLMKPALGWINTALLVSTNALVAFASRRLLRGSPATAWKAAALAILAASVFVGLKMYEYRGKIDHRLLPATANDVIPYGRVWASYYFGLTGIHAAHVVVGILLLWWIVFLGVTNKLGARHGVLLQNVSSYWYLVDGVWLIIFPLLYLF